MRGVHSVLLLDSLLPLTSLGEHRGDPDSHRTLSSLPGFSVSASDQGGEAHRCTATEQSDMKRVDSMLPGAQVRQLPPGGCRDLITREGESGNSR